MAPRPIIDSIFDPLVSRWFSEKYPAPTAVQREAWPEIQRGAHVLLTAPTGSGKTLAAFLVAVDRFIRGNWPEGHTSVLYVSPLRALNNDIQRNLLAPLGELRALFEAEGRPFPRIAPMTRSGDTEPSERRKMLRHPPEILITTPESLNILLTSRSGQNLLCGLKLVVLDEVHAVAGSKRGVQLITAVERLTLLAGEFQRLGLSATVHPLREMAAWLGGGRTVATVDTGEKKEVELSLRYVDPKARSTSPQENATDNPLWRALAEEATEAVRRNRSTLIFAPSRRLVERIASLINEAAGERLVFAHHGSLSREIRTVVERRFKNGELKGIVATNSLELGIDIGAIDEVLLLQTPPSISATVQRIGRSGHSVGQRAVAQLLPTHPVDVLLSVVTADCVLKGELDPVPLEGPALDVLAQSVLSMTVHETIAVDELFEFFRGVHPYRNLGREPFDLVIEMLAGRYAGARLPALRPRIEYDRLEGTITARRGTERLLYSSGGTIPDRGYYKVRLSGANNIVGELDEEFVWERTVGETITLGVQNWTVDRIGSNDVFVTPALGTRNIAPFWRSERRVIDWWLAERISGFLFNATSEVAAGRFKGWLAERLPADEVAARTLEKLLVEQAEATGVLPHRRRLVIEQIARGNTEGHRYCVLHTVWGGRINRALGLALRAAWRKREEDPLEFEFDDFCLLLDAPERFELERELAGLEPLGLERQVGSELLSTGIFGARFRENAGRALLLPRRGFNKRVPLWQTRQRAKELYDAVAPFDDFPLVLETLRSCMLEDVDVHGLAARLDELRDGTIQVHQGYTEAPSPLAREVFYMRTNELMYADDQPGGAVPSVRADLAKIVAAGDDLRPRIPVGVADDFDRKLKRLSPEDAPLDSRGLLEWIKERLVVPADEWQRMLGWVAVNCETTQAQLAAELSQRVVGLRVPPAGGVVFVALENLPRWVAAAGMGPQARLNLLDAEEQPLDAPMRNLVERVLLEQAVTEGDPRDTLLALVAEWLLWSGPVTLERLSGALGINTSLVSEALVQLVDAERVVGDPLLEGAMEPEFILADNLSRLIRYLSSTTRVAVHARPARELPGFLARIGGLGASRTGVGSLQDAVEGLMGYPAAAEAWEQEILPARLQGYLPSLLDDLVRAYGLIWLGAGKKKISLCLDGERELFHRADEVSSDEQELLAELMPQSRGRHTASELAVLRGSGSLAEMNESLWRLAWAGLVTSDSFEVVRRGVAANFTTGPTASAEESHSRRPRTLRRSRWGKQAVDTGLWYTLDPVEPPNDALEELELGRERARVLFDRYGILFRELLERELAPLRWGKLYRALLLMELSGEVYRGRFFEGVAGVQFISKEAYEQLREDPDDEHVFWLGAQDPLSLCGVGIEGLELFRRVAGTHLVWHGTRLVLVSTKRGKTLEIRVPPDDPNLPRYFGPLQHLLERQSAPLSLVTVETINDEPSRSSAYRGALEQRFSVSADHRALLLSRRV